MSSSRPIDCCFVKGHSANLGNDHADRLAGVGAKGQQSTQSARWLVPAGAPEPVSPLSVDHCWRCGRVFSGDSYGRQLAGHEAYCKIPGAPPAHIPCRRKCGRTFPWRSSSQQGKHKHHAREARNLHEKICRGSEELTRVCPFCDTVFPEACSDELLFQHRSHVRVVLQTPACYCQGGDVRIARRRPPGARADRAAGLDIVVFRALLLRGRGSFVVGRSGAGVLSFLSCFLARLLPLSRSLLPCFFCFFFCVFWFVSVKFSKAICACRWSVQRLAWA